MSLFSHDFFLMSSLPADKSFLSPQVQVFAPGTPALKQSSVPPKEANPGDQMQMLMMNQMMMQQMAAQQQLQAAQLSALSGGNARGQYCGRSNGRGSTSVNIRSELYTS